MIWQDIEWQRTGIVTHRFSDYGWYEEVKGEDEYGLIYTGKAVVINDEIESVDFKCITIELEGSTSLGESK